MGTTPEKLRPEDFGEVTIHCEYDGHPGEQTRQLLSGWRQNDEAVRRGLEDLVRMGDKPTFQEAAPHLENYWQGEDIGLWEAAKKVNNGQHLPADRQTIGDCESHGNGRGVDYLHCVMQTANLADGFVEGQTSCCTEVLYGEGKEVGNDLSSQDGACGIWMVKALAQFGFVGREGKPYDGRLAKQYGARGVPSELKEKGRSHVLHKYTLLQSTDDMANALKAGCPCPISSSQGFSMTRNADGIARAEGRWDHCMLVIGLVKIGGRRIFVILQSWGQNTPDGPMPFGAPDNAFGCEEATMAGIIRYGDSYALWGLAGYQPLPPLDWVM